MRWTSPITRTSLKPASASIARSSLGRTAVRDQSSASSKPSMSDSSSALEPTILRNALDTLHLMGVDRGSLNQSPSVYARMPPSFRTRLHSEMTLRGSGTVQSM
ncbi:MAG: hypothetical protein Q4Q62_02500 [Thermoplasmata archaeon]|nr:hypothetical protein [Thermoplasmata archaeon]